MTSSAAVRAKAAMTPQTITSGQKVPATRTPAPAAMTATLAMASFREHSQTERMLASPSRYL